MYFRKHSHAGILLFYLKIFWFPGRLFQYLPHICNEIQKKIQQRNVKTLQPTSYHPSPPPFCLILPALLVSLLERILFTLTQRPQNAGGKDSNNIGLTQDFSYSWIHLNPLILTASITVLPPYVLPTPLPPISALHHPLTKLANSSMSIAGTEYAFTVWICM